MTGQDEQRALAAQMQAYDSVIDTPCLICGRYRDPSNDTLPIAVGTAPRFKGVICARCARYAKEWVAKL